MNKSLLALSALPLALALASAPAHAQTPDKVRIGFVTDMSSLYSDVDGKGGLTAIQMAIDDFGGKVNGLPIELLSADHQNKADIAASKAREWMDTQGLSLLIGGTNSGTGLAMAKVLQRTAGVDLNAAREAAAASPDDVDAQTMVADLDMLGGHVEDAFTRLVELVRRTSGDDRDRAREHLLGLFAAVGNDDPRVLKGRQNLASALF